MTRLCCKFTIPRRSMRYLLIFSISLLSELRPTRRTSLLKTPPEKIIFIMGPRAHLSSKQMSRQLATDKKVKVALLMLIGSTLRRLARWRPRICSRLW